MAKKALKTPKEENEQTLNSSAEGGWLEDPYFKKRIPYSLNRQEFLFDAGELLFSTFEIDLGSQFLLRNILAANITSPAHILDLGCGYGVIGIVLARFFSAAEVILSDKDLLAVRYARHNAELNKATNVTVVGGVGPESVPAQAYDLIISNVPAKIGDPAIERDFLLRPLEMLAPGGSYWIVVISALNRLIPALGRRHELSMTEIARRPGHTLYKITR